LFQGWDGVGSPAEYLELKGFVVEYVSDEHYCGLIPILDPEGW
jgi:hypothetical protein